MELTSPHNPVLQNVRRAVEQGRALDDGAIAAEGPHLLAEALKSAWSIEHIFCAADGMEVHRSLLQDAYARRIEVTTVAARAFKSVSDTEHSQGIVFLARPREYGWDHLLSCDGPLVVLDGIQDPGNAGTIVRSAEAFGACGVVFSEGSVRISNGKFLRATAGSAFRVPCVTGALRSRIIQEVETTKRKLYALAAGGGCSLWGADLREPFALIAGNEGAGVSKDLLDAATSLSIPTRAVESLNAAVACSLALHEAARQRGV